MTHMESLRKKARAYYAEMEQMYRVECGKNNPLSPLMDEYDAAHPGLDAFELKAALYEVFAENIETMVFEETPFYFINNMCFRDGVQHWNSAGWLHRRNQHIYQEADPEAWRKFTGQQALRVFLCCGPYADTQHFCFPVQNVVFNGLKKYYDDIEAAKDGATEEELKFLNAGQRGLLAAKRVCERYVEAAKAKLVQLEDPVLRANMELLIESASSAPWNAPKTFFEGLNACWFCRNVLGTIDAIGNAHLGRVDYILWELYQKDLAEGRITREQAYEWIKQFVLLGDMQYDKDSIVEGAADHEMEMGICIGGCDPEGKPVYNELTSMFIRAHREMHCVYPKIHARFASDSPKEYLEELAQEFVNSRSVIGLSNDDSIIPALLKSGKSLVDARNYTTNGCWGIKVDSRESAGGGNYFHLITLLEQAVYGPEPEYIDVGLECEPLENASSFEDVYRVLARNAQKAMRWRCETLGKYGKLATKVNPLCLSSVLMDGCIESRKDYTQGGAIYNISTCDPTGFANYVDAMLAIKTLCFKEKKLSLYEFLEAVRSNWEGQEELLHEVRNCPHFGDQSQESLELSERLHCDLYDALQGIENEHGGEFIMNYYVYREFIMMGKKVRATPDGRRNGEMFALGIGVSKYHPGDPLTAVAQSVGNLDATKSVTSSLDVQLPLGGMTKEKLGMILHALAAAQVKHLQLNCVSIDELRDAQKHPEKYQDLIVRICGFSAKFVSLAPMFQEEVIGRYQYQEV